jgi:predicted dehydrogenase
MKALVIGVGSIGRRHIGNLNGLGIVPDVADIVDANLDYARDNYQVGATYKDYRDAACDKYDFAMILTPPSSHVPIATELARQGTDLFIEKPLGNDLGGVDNLIKAVDERHVIAMVGYNQRFSPGILRLKEAIDRGTLGRIYYIRAEFGQYLPDWRPTQDYRKNYTAIRAMGGGIMLDDSHELDYVMWLAGSPVKSVRAMADTVSDLEIDVEDMAEFTLAFENRVMASIHMDMVEQGYNRYCKVVGAKGSMKWTFKDSMLEHYDGSARRATVEKLNVDPNQSYVDELKYFLDCVRERKEPMSNLRTAKAALGLIVKAKEGSAL